MWYFPRSMALLLFVMVAVPLLVSGAPEIQFSFGRVQGADRFAKDTQRPYYAYYGIPFAQPPLGNLRFRAPQPFVGSGPNVVISSNTFRDGCSQRPVEGAPISYSEDCLYINVYTPADRSNVKKVMFWIHPGSHQQNDAAQYVPSRLVTDNDVIVVTTQYRLGAFGFMGTGKGDTNNGLRDLIMALTWLKDNIAQFGGDPDDITIFGVSAGARAVSLLSISPLTKGLFTKAIMQSGTMLGTFVVNPNPVKLFDDTADRLGCTGFFSVLRWFHRELYESLVMNCVRTKTVQEILPMFSDPFNNHIPIVDGEVIPRNPKSLMADRQYLQDVGTLDRSFVVGFSNKEGLLIQSNLLPFIPLEVVTLPEKAKENILSLVSPMFPYVSSLSQEAWDFIDYAYLYPRQEDGRVPFQGIVDATTDATYTLPSVQFARAITTFSDRVNLYLYLFDHYPEVKDPSAPFEGFGHALDIFYEFDEDAIFNKETGFYANVPSARDGNVGEIFKGFLAQFAKTGNPARINAEPRSWPRFDPKQEYYMALSPNPEIRQHVFAKRVSLWTDFVFKKV